MTHGATRGLLGLAAAAALLVAGCGDDAAAPKPRPTPPPKPPTSEAPKLPSKPYTIEQLGTQLGCKPKEAGKAKDFRQASCVVDGENVTLLQFDKEQGQEDWLTYATNYGGIYLSGKRWVLSGKSLEYMEGLQQKLGGAIEARSAG